MTNSAGDVTVSFPELRVFVRGYQVHLSLQQTKLLLILMDEKRAVSAAELVRRIDLTSESALRLLVCGLKKSIGDYIYNDYGHGYLLLSAGAGE